MRMLSHYLSAAFHRACVVYCPYALCAESAVPAPAPAPLAAAPESGEFHWWDKMDNKVLNEKDTEAPKVCKVH